jgi:hypothetical protein
MKYYKKFKKLYFLKNQQKKMDSPKRFGKLIDFDIIEYEMLTNLLIVDVEKELLHSNKKICRSSIILDLICCADNINGCRRVYFHRINYLHLKKRLLQVYHFEREKKDHEVEHYDWFIEYVSKLTKNGMRMIWIATRIFLTILIVKKIFLMILIVNVMKTVRSNAVIVIVMSVRSNTVIVIVMTMIIEIFFK